MSLPLRSRENCLTTVRRAIAIDECFHWDFCGIPADGRCRECITCQSSEGMMMGRGGWQGMKGTEGGQLELDSAKSYLDFSNVHNNFRSI